MKYGFLSYLCSVKHNSMRARPRNIHTAAACAKRHQRTIVKDFVSANRVGGGNKPGVRSIEELDSA